VKRLMRHIAVAGVALAVAAETQAQTKPAPTADQVIQGIVQKIDGASNTVVVKTRKGTEQVLHFTERTTRLGAEGIRQGATVVVHASEQGGRQVAHQTKNIGTKTVEVVEGTVTKIDKVAKTVTIRTVNGSVQVFNYAKDGVMHIGAGMKAAGIEIGDAVKEGMQVVVHHTTEAGQKIAHAIHQKS